MFDYVSELKATQFREGKELQNIGIRGVAGLKRKSIRKIPAHYGRAIRGNVGDAGKMKKAVMAIYRSTEVETIAGISVIPIVVPWTGQTESL